MRQVANHPPFLECLNLTWASHVQIGRITRAKFASNLMGFSLDIHLKSQHPICNLQLKQELL